MTKNRIEVTLDSEFVGGMDLVLCKQRSGFAMSAYSDYIKIREYNLIYLYKLTFNLTKRSFGDEDVYWTRIDN